MKKSVIILWAVAVVLLISAVQLFTQGTIAAGVFGITAAAACAFFGWRTLQKQKAIIEKARQEQAEKEAAQAERDAAKARWNETHKYITFAVAGVTFKNDDGKSRQAILKRKRKEQEDGVIITALNQYVFAGKPAVAVLIDDEMVGSVPKTHLPEVLKAIESGTIEALYSEVEDFEDDEGKRIMRCDVTFAYEI